MNNHHWEFICSRLYRLIYEIGCGTVADMRKWRKKVKKKYSQQYNNPNIKHIER